MRSGAPPSFCCARRSSISESKLDLIPPPRSARGPSCRREIIFEARRTSGATIDAYTELTTHGQVGPLTNSLVESLFGQQVHRYRALRPPSGWDDESIREVAQDFLATKYETIVDAALSIVGSQEELTRYMSKMVRNFLVDAA